MDNAQALKDKARTLEHGGQDQAALDLYARLAEGVEKPDPGLLIRMGNLQLRVDRPEQAVSSFMRASALLQEGGYINSAIALLHRVVRIQPHFAPALLRLGELGAQMGYLRDARDWLRGYVELMEESGEPEVGWDALRSHLSNFPGDSTMRGYLIQRLEAHGQAEQAEREADALPDPSSGEEAGDVPPRPGDSPPDASLATLDGRDADPSDAADELPVIGSEWEGADAAAAELDPEAGLDLVSTRIGEEEADQDQVAPLAGLEPTRLEGLETTEPDPDWTETEPAAADDESLPLLGSEVAASEDDVDAGSEAGEEVDSGRDLPLLGVTPGADEEATRTEADPAVVLRARVVRDPDDLDARHELIALYQERGDAEALAAALEEAHPRFAAAGRFPEAADLVSSLIDLRPDDESLLERRVEYASRSGESARVIAALLALGRRLGARADAERAQEIFLRVLEVDPDNEESRRALAALSADPSSPTLPDYIDFRDLLLSDEPEPTTRAQVPVSHPSGDDDRDFAEILSLFRQQVSEQIDPADAASHYDLGLAFKEMGLLDDAIGQLQVALRGGANPVATLEVLGECFVEKGEHSLAVRVFRRATEVPTADDDALVGVRYWLGRCEEALGNPEAAQTEYERVVAADIGFRDAAARLAALRSR